MLTAIDLRWVPVNRATVSCGDGGTESSNITANLRDGGRMLLGVVFGTRWHGQGPLST